ncbi:hypothetical protein GF352_04705 [archaeon]|nr:hypothetical protein [archaeon]
MKLKDFCLWAKTPGMQVNMSVLLMVISFSGFIYTYYASLYWPLTLSSPIMGTFLALGLFYLGYTLILSYFMIKNYYF